MYDMKTIFIRLAVFFCLLAVAFPLFSQSAPANADGRMDWWREAKFGMFIHWGVYSVFENKYDGLDVNGNQVHHDGRNSGIPAEWIMRYVLIPRSVYREAAKQFDAKDYDPKLWVQMAKEAGMKYIIITSKHHDGFCLFDSQYTEWDAVDASPAGRDLLQDLVTEARAAGLKIGFYYSQNQDWMHEGGMSQIPELNGGYYSPEQVRNYVNNLVIPHIQELAVKYDFDVMWFDSHFAENIDIELNKTILQALRDSPVGHKIITNDRLYLDCERDFITPESDTPDIPYNGFFDNQDWEACASLNNSWGYEGDSESLSWKSTEFTIGRILELTSKGGNFLLNVGPDKHGVIPAPAIRTLKGVGKWMGKNGVAVYGTDKNQLLNPFEYGYVTQKTIASDGQFHWYLHISTGYWNEGKSYLYGIVEQPLSATYLANGTPADVEWNNDILTIHLPEVAPDDPYVTIDLCFDRLPAQLPMPQIRNNKIRLTPYQATTSNGLRKDFLPYALKGWYSKSCEAHFNLYLEKGEYTLQSEYAGYDSGELYFNINNQIHTAYYSKTAKTYPGDNDMDTYITEDFPYIKIQIPQSGIYQLVVTRNAEIPDHFNIINVRSFTLKRTDDVGGLIELKDKPFCSPNPATNGYFYCNIFPGQSIRLYDMSGRLVKSCIVGENQTVEVSDLTSGIYIVEGVGMKEKMVVVNISR
jgi:alpha-L-fucosidase